MKTPRRSRKVCDLFTSAGLEPNSISTHFRPDFLADLQRHGAVTAGGTRKRHGIPGDNHIGGVVLSLWQAGTIAPAGTGPAEGPLSHRRLTHKWKLAPKGGRQ